MQHQSPRLAPWALQQERGSREREVLEKWSYSISWLLEMKKVHFSCTAVPKPGYLDKDFTWFAQHWEPMGQMLAWTSGRVLSLDSYCTSSLTKTQFWLEGCLEHLFHQICLWESSRNWHLWTFPGENEWVLENHHAKFKVTQLLHCGLHFQLAGFKCSVSKALGAIKSTLMGLWCKG